MRSLRLLVPALLLTGALSACGFPFPGSPPTVVDVAEVEPNNTTGTANLVSGLPARITGEFSTTDADWNDMFSIAGDEGTLTAKCTVTSGTAPPLSILIINVPTGNTTGASCNGVPFEVVGLTGEYRVQVVPIADPPVSPATYAIDLSFDEHTVI